MTAVTDGSIYFPGKCQGMFSVFSYGGDAHGVSEDGGKYGLKDASLHFDEPMGVSNEFMGEPVNISVEQGTLVVLFNCSARELEKMVREGYC